MGDSPRKAFMHHRGVTLIIFLGEGETKIVAVVMMLLIVVSVFSTVASNLITSESASGLVGYWKFDEGSGATASDSSGNGNTGTLHGGATWTDGKFAKALNFNGIDGYVQVPQSSSLDVTAQVTVEAWVNLRAYVDSVGDESHVVSRSNGMGGPYYVLATHANGKIGYDIGVFTGYHQSAATLPLNSWTHLAMTYDGAHVCLYINGVFDSNYAQSGPIPTTSNWLAIGCKPTAPHGGPGTYAYTNGIIDEVRIYNRALSQSDVQTDMNGDHFLPPTAVSACALPSMDPLEIELQWSPPLPSSETVQSYMIFRGTSAHNELLLISVPSTQTSYYDKVGSKGIYYYYLEAVYSTGISTASNEVICAPPECFSGIENVIYLSSFSIDKPFTIQQNIRVRLAANRAWEVQNVVWVDSMSHYIGGAIQVFEIADGVIPKLPFAWYPLMPGVPFNPGSFNSTIVLKVLIENSKVKVFNPCYFEQGKASYDLSFSVGSAFISTEYWSPVKELQSSPELVLVANQYEAQAGHDADFHTGTVGKVNSYLRVTSTSGDQWFVCDKNHVIKYTEGLATAERSIGLHWGIDGGFSYDSAYESKDSAEEGLWIVPGYEVPVSNVPSMTKSTVGSLFFGALCPVYLDLYNEYGECTGFNATSGTVDSGISNAFWVSNQTMFVIDPSGVYSLNVTGIDNGTYELETSWQDVTGTTAVISDLNSTITENETQVYTIGAVPNMTLMNVLSSKTVVCQGFGLQVDATVADLSGVNMTFDVSVYANETLIGNQSALSLSGWNSTTACFTWNTTGQAYGNYTLSASVQPVSNNFTGGWVFVSMIGDLTGPSPEVPDGKVDIRDIALVAKSFGSTPGDSGWNANCDITGPTQGVPDGKIDIRDIAIVAKHFGESASYPP